MTAAMNAVVTVKSIKVFGDSKEYPADEVTMKKFVKWAMETKADPEIAGNARSSGNASGHPATPVAIRQRQWPYGNAKCHSATPDAI